MASKKVIEGRISSLFGHRKHPISGAVKFHNGVDIAAAIGTPIYSPFDGVVVAAYFHRSGGQTIILRGTNGDRAGFCHLNERLVGVGDRVLKGWQIGKSGNTGASTGPHLHYTYALAENVDWNASASGRVITWENSAKYITIK